MLQELLHSMQISTPLESVSGEHRLTQTMHAWAEQDPDMMPMWKLSLKTAQVLKEKEFQRTAMEKERAVLQPMAVVVEMIARPAVEEERTACSAETEDNN